MPEPITEECPKCRKDPALCVCDRIVRAKTKLHVLILQHPQEPDKELGSARIAHLALSNSTLRVGLSWPNLSKALGRSVIQSNWGILYLGSKEGAPEAKLNPIRKLEGIVVLDGTWTQAKTLWWRNAWMLKLQRIALKPSRPSLYGRLRKEPRKECLSTIESIAEALETLGEDPAVSKSLRSYFGRLLQIYRDRQPSVKESTLKS